MCKFHHNADMLMQYFIKITHVHSFKKQLPIPAEKKGREPTQHEYTAIFLIS